MRVNTERIKARERAFEAIGQGSPVLLRIGSGRTQCTTPVELHMFGYPDPLCIELGTEVDAPVGQRVLVRCRKCDGCLAHRARLWTARAMCETQFSQRTWFGTLTLAPDRQLHARYSAMSQLIKGGWAQSEITDQVLFEKRVSIISPEITRFLKRVRKTRKLRYLLVTEAHKSGDPHFHILIHEYDGCISKRVLEDKWRFGFSHWRLVEPGNEQACGYCCKYLSKSALTRVRASERYGQGTPALITERILETTRTIGAEKKRGLFASVEGPLSDERTFVESLLRESELQNIVEGS